VAFYILSSTRTSEELHAMAFLRLSHPLLDGALLVYLLATELGHRSRGHGTALNNAIFDFVDSQHQAIGKAILSSESSRSIYLVIRQENFRAAQLYKRMGFKLALDTADRAEAGHELMVRSFPQIAAKCDGQVL